VKTALKRGVEYGILRKYRGHYFLPTGDELERANRIAGRFAGLSVPLFSRSKMMLGFERRIKNDKRPRRIANRTARRTKRDRKSSSPHAVSASSSWADEITDDSVME
jgi:hypothetical protein